MRIAFIDLSTRLETVYDLESRPRGGMVSSLFKVSDYLARFADVEVLSDIELEGETEAGVKWRKEPHGPYDVLITNRGIGSGYSYIQARHRVLWTHDLPHVGFIEEPKTMKAFSATVFMSRYAEKIWRAMFPAIGRSFMIPNGVDRDLFRPKDKDLNYLIYISAPNRGLKRLPFLFDCIQSRTGRPIYMTAFSNLSRLHPNEVGERDEFEQDYKAVSESQVTLCDPVPQAELASELGAAGLMILPTEYPEICSNSILQALSCGVPIVTTGHLGSAHEWINRSNGRLTEFHPHDYMIYQMEIVRHATTILNDENLHRRMVDGACRSDVLTWDEIGAKWWRMLRALSRPFSISIGL